MCLPITSHACSDDSPSSPFAALQAAVLGPVLSLAQGPHHLFLGLSPLHKMGWMGEPILLDQGVLSDAPAYLLKVPFLGTFKSCSAGGS